MVQITYSKIESLYCFVNTLPKDTQSEFSYHLYFISKLYFIFLQTKRIDKNIGRKENQLENDFNGLSEQRSTIHRRSKEYGIV